MSTSVRLSVREEPTPRGEVTQILVSRIERKDASRIRRWLDEVRTYYPSIWIPMVKRLAREYNWPVLAEAYPDGASNVRDLDEAVSTLTRDYGEAILSKCALRLVPSLHQFILEITNLDQLDWLVRAFYSYGQLTLFIVERSALRDLAHSLVGADGPKDDVHLGDIAARWRCAVLGFTPMGSGLRVLVPTEQAPRVMRTLHDGLS